MTRFVAYLLLLATSTTHLPTVKHMIVSAALVTYYMNYTKWHAYLLRISDVQCNA